MNKKINLLDCTLRDGGYVNDWDFGYSVITGTYKRLDAAGVDYIEVGFLDERRPFDRNRTIMPSTNAINEIYRNVNKKHAIPVAMIDYGTCSLDKIADCDKSFIDGIRVIFKKEKIEEALPFCKAIKEKGYKLFVQAISITAYSDIEMLQYVEKINEIKPYAFSVVDTYGLLDKFKLTKYFYLIDNNLDPEFKFGYHAHNNFQLGFSNTINLLSLETKREIIVDSTVYGMGKSAGNCPTELLAMHLNEHYDKNYDMNQILEIIDTDLMAIYRKRYWGYKYDFYISALNDCHPDYVHYLLNKKTLSISAINGILKSIPYERKLLYDSNYIEREYTEYQKNTIDDNSVYDKFKTKLEGKKVLVIGPGRSIITDQNGILKYIDENHPVVFTTNFIPDICKTDYVFISNAKRYSKLADMLLGKEINAEVIATSNITVLDYPIDYTLNYESLLMKDDLDVDNALVLLLNAFIKLEIPSVTLAGFDGFTANYDDYYERGYSFGSDDSPKNNRNDIMSKALTKLSSFLKIDFLTSTLYKIGGIEND